MNPQIVTRMPLHTHHEPKERRLFDVIDGRFQPLQEIGCGAVCLVHLAKDKSTGHMVALKRLRWDMLENKNSRYTLQTENQALLLMQDAGHPGIPRIISASLGSDPYVAEQFMDGLPFALNNVRDRRTAIMLSISVCGVLATLHKAGIVYRDLKPSNIVLKHDFKSISLTDFGYAILPGMEDFAMRVDIPVGTPMFMAPEQTYPKQRVDHRADIYALGVVLYVFLSGWYPYTFKEGENERENCFQAHRSQEAVPLHMRNPTIPKRLSYVVASALAKEPEKRFQDAEEMADALSDCLAPIDSFR